MNGKKRNGNYWAIEFDGDEVRLCRFALQGDQAVVSQCGTMPVDQFDFPRLRAQDARGGADEIHTLCAVPRSEVFLKPFTVPKSPDVDVRKITALKLEQSVTTLDPNTTLWGSIEGEMPGETRRVRVLAATIPRDYVNGLMEKHFGEGNRPAVMECGALSAVRAHLASTGEPARCELIVDCANDGLSVFVLKHGIVDLAHFIPARQPLRMALTEIRRVILTSSGDGDKAAVERVTCLGGRTARELAEALRPSLGIPVAEGIDPAARPAAEGEALPADWEQNWHRIAGLLELAATGTPAPINFLAGRAPRRKVKLTLPVIEGLRTPVLAVALVLMLVAAVMTQRALARRRDALMDRVVTLGRKVTADLERQQATLKLLNTYRARRYSLFRVLAEFHDLVPAGVTLDSLTLNPDGTVSVSGRGKRYPEGHELASQLNASEYFESAATPSGRRDGKSVVFKTTFKLTSKARKVKP